DTLGITNPADSVTGRQLLEKGGVLGKNKPGLDLGDVAGFGMEMLTDPLSWISGPGKAVTKALASGQPIKRLEKTLKNFGSLQEAIDAGVNVGAKESAHIGNLERLAKGAETLHDFEKKKLIATTKAMNPGLKDFTDEAVLSHVLRPQPIVAFDKQQRNLYRAARKTHTTQAEEVAKAIDTMLPKQEIVREVLENPGVSPSRIVQEIREGNRALVGVQAPWPFSKVLGNEPLATFGKGKLAADIADKLYYNPLTASVRHIFDSRVKRAGEDVMAQRIADIANAHAFDELAKVQDQMLEINKQLPDLQATYNDLHKAYPTMQPKTFEEAMRDAAETKGFDYMQGLAKQANASPDLMQKAASFDALAKQITGLQDQAYAHARSLGMHGRDLDDVIGHTFRGANPLLHKFDQGMFAKVSNFGGSKQRKNPLRRMLTSRIRQASTEANPFAGTLYGKTLPKDQLNDALEKGAEWLEKNLGVSRKVKLPSAKGPARNYDQAKELAKIVMNLPPEVIKTGGLFPRATSADALNYLRRLTQVRGALMGVHDMVHRFAKADEVGPTVEQLFKGLKLKEGLPTWAKKFAEANGGQAVDPATLHVPQALADSAARILNYTTKPQEMNRLLKAFDGTTGIIKGSLTVPFPAFHMRNALSGLWQNAVTAFTDPVHGKQAMLDAVNALRGKNPQLIEEMRIHGLLPEGWMGEELLGKGAQGEFRPERLLGDVLNPMRALRRGARNLSAGQGKIGKLKSFASGPTNEFGERLGGLGTWGRDATNLVEFFNRASHFAARKRSGWSNGMAARSTKLTHFDYSALSNTEKAVFKRLAPFYAFSAFNLPLQIRQLINSPGGPTAQTIRAMANARREGGAGDSVTGNWLPARLGESTAFMLPGQNPDKQRDVRFFAENALLPISEAANRFPTMEGVPNPKLIGENLMSMVHPFIQEPVSMLMNRSFWKHAPRDSYYPWPTNNDTINALLALPPQSRAMALARMVGDEHKGPAEKIFNALLGGMRLTDVDLRKEGAQYLRQALEARLDRAPGVGEFTRRYPAQPERLSQSSIEDLDALNAILKELTKIRKEDEASGRRTPRAKAPKPKKKAAA
ncbi:MAG: hypothetical protein KGL39_28045, partial [Patescibacteria group bacterium]|nr:hypothetical protein [Patescibacteria group bacterium]